MITVFLKKLIKFCLLAIGVYILLVIIWGEFSPGFLKDNLSYQKLSSGYLTTRLTEARTTNDVDILFLGSSRSYRHYDPRIFRKEGFSSFNLGSSSQTMIQTEYFIDKYLADLSPAIVIFDLYPRSFASDGVESTLDIISNSSLNYENIKMALNHWNIKVINTLIFSLYRQSFYSEERLPEGKAKGSNDTYINGGFVEKDLKFFRFTGELEPSLEKNFKGKQIASFKRIIEKIRATGAKVYLVSSPSSSFKAQYYRDYDALGPALGILDLEIKFFEIPQLNDTLHFYDPDHLNQNGVKIYNDVFLETFENFR